MKKYLLLLTALTTLVTFSLTLTSCGDDEEDSPTYELDLFLGDWELSNSTDPDYKECTGDRPVLTVTGSNIIAPMITISTGCQSGSSTFSHNFTGKAFEVAAGGLTVTYTIQSASETRFSWKDSFVGYVETYEKVD